MADETDATVFDFASEDSSHQGCYVLRPSTTTVTNGDCDDEINDRPRKKRKSNPPSSVKPQPHAPVLNDAWPRLCSGTEPPSLVKLRQLTYRNLWKQEEDRIDQTAGHVDESLLQRIKSFVTVNEPRKGKLTSALLVSGAQDRGTSQLLRRWQSAQQERSPPNGDNETIIQLSPAQAPNLQGALKNLIRLALEAHASSQTYIDFLAESKRLIPMSFDLELLQIYAQKHSMSRIVLAIDDAETFDLAVLSELLFQLAMWSDRIPFAIVLGIGSTIELFESRLSKATIRLLDVQVFEVSRNGDQFYDVFCAVQNNPDTRLFVGPATMSVLYDMSQDQSTSVSAFKRALKYIYMSHFFANPLSALLANKNTILEDKSRHPLLAEAIRNTPSFQSYCFSSLSHPSLSSKVRGLLNKDSETVSAALAGIHTEQRRLSSTRQTIALFIGLYTHPDLHLPSLSRFELDLHLTQCLHHPTSQPLSSTSIYADLISTLRHLPPTKLTTLLTTLGAPSDIKSLNSLTTLFSTLTPTSTRSSTSPPHLTLPESHLFNLRHPLVTSIPSPHPRSALERALSQPADYLNCLCCSTSTTNTTSSSSSATTSLLYNLLTETGREINVRDLWEIFYQTVTTSTTISPKSNKRVSRNYYDNDTDGKEKDMDGIQEQQQQRDARNDNDEDEEEEDEKELETHALALFYRSLAELKMLGLVKSGSSKIKGVDVISKTTWKGL